MSDVIKVYRKNFEVYLDALDRMINGAEPLSDIEKENLLRLVSVEKKIIQLSDERKLYYDAWHLAHESKETFSPEFKKQIDGYYAIYKKDTETIAKLREELKPYCLKYWEDIQKESM